MELTSSAQTTQKSTCSFYLPHHDYDIEDAAATQRPMIYLGFIYTFRGFWTWMASVCHQIRYLLSIDNNRPSKHEQLLTTRGSSIGDILLSLICLLPLKDGIRSNTFRQSLIVPILIVLPQTIPYLHPVDTPSRDVYCIFMMEQATLPRPQWCASGLLAVEGSLKPPPI